MTTKKVLGIQYLTSKKDGKTYTLLHIGQSITENGTGLSVDKIFLNSSVSVAGIQVGDFVKVIYDKGVGDKAYVVDIIKVDVPQKK